MNIVDHSGAILPFSSESHPRPRFYARLLGSLSIVQYDSAGEAVPVPLLIPSKAKHLLAYLLLHKGWQTPRLRLAFEFWAELPEQQARRALSQSIWHIQRLFPGLLEKKEDTIQVTPGFPIQLDVEEFELKARSGLFLPVNREQVIQDLSAAVKVYRGDLLEYYYDDWVLADRERLRELYLRALEKLVQELKAAGRFDQALMYALVLVRNDPLRENAHRELMKIHHIMGRPGASIRQYEELRVILKRDLDVEPEPETQTLAQAILSSRGTITSSIASLDQRRETPRMQVLDRDPKTPMFGRETLTAELLSMLEDAQHGKGGMALVEGEIGIGKTRLLQEVSREAEWRGFWVFWSKALESGDPSSRVLLFEALSSEFHPLSFEQVSRLAPEVSLLAIQDYFPDVQTYLGKLPALSALEPAEEIHRITDGIIALLSALAQIQPVVIVLEDLQWADGLTFTLLPRLLPHLDGKAALILGSIRSEELDTIADLGEKIPRLQDGGMKGIFKLAGLDEGTSKGLVQFILGSGSLDAESMTRLHQASRGNPLFLIEMITGLREQGKLIAEPHRDEQSGESIWRIKDKDLQVESDTLPIPPTIKRIILQRLSGMPEELQSILSILSVIGYRISTPALLTIDLPLPTLFRAISSLLGYSLLVETPHEYRFSHDMLHQVIYDSIPIEERRRLHLQYAQLLEKVQPDQVDRLAYHYTEGHAWQKALEYQRQAASRASQLHQYHASIACTSKAITAAKHLELPVHDIFDLYAERESLLDIVGERTTQLADLEELEKIGVGIDNLACKAAIRRAHYDCQVCRFDQAQAAANKALEYAARLSDSNLRAEALVSLGRISDGRGEVKKAIQYYQEALEIYRPEQNHPVDMEIRKLLANALAKTDNYEYARAEIIPLLAKCEQTDDQPGCSLMLLLLGVMTDNHTGNTEEAIGYLERALDICRQIGHRSLEAHILLNLYRSLKCAGKTALAWETLDQAEAACRFVGERRGEAMVHCYRSSDQLELCGDFEVARTEAQEGLRIIHETGDGLRESLCLNQLGLVEINLGERDAARIHLDEAARHADATDYKLGQLTANLSKARLEISLHQYQEALARLERIEVQCQQDNLEIWTVRVQSEKAYVYLKLGRPGDALETTQLAIKKIRPGHKAQYPLLFIHSQALTALGRIDEARGFLDECYQTLNERLAGLTPEQKLTSWEKITLHKEIAAAWQAAQPKKILVRLPRWNAPTGRPLHSDEWVDIIWTVYDPADNQWRGKVLRRRNVLLRLLREASQQGATPSYEHLAQALGVSVRTIAADLFEIKREYHTLPYTPR